MNYDFVKLKFCNKVCRKLVNMSIKEMHWNVNFNSLDFYLIKVKNKPVGFFTRVKRDNNDFELTHIYLKPKFRGCGISTDIIINMVDNIDNMFVINQPNADIINILLNNNLCKWCKDFVIPTIDKLAFSTDSDTEFGNYCFVSKVIWYDSIKDVYCICLEGNDDDDFDLLATNNYIGELNNNQELHNHYNQLVNIVPEEVKKIRLSFMMERIMNGEFLKALKRVFL